MKIKQLKELIENLPDEAEVYVEADHGQLSERAHDVMFCNDNYGYVKLPYYGGDLDWFEKQEVENEDIVAILIMA